MVFGSGGPFWRWLGHEGGALMNGISLLIKEIPASSLQPSTIWGHREKMAEWKNSVSSVSTTMTYFWATNIWAFFLYQEFSNSVQTLQVRGSVSQDCPLLPLQMPIANPRLSSELLTNCNHTAHTGTSTQLKSRLGLESIVFSLKSCIRSQDLMKLRFCMSHHRKNSVRDKVVGKKWIYLQRYTFHRIWSLS